MKENNNLEKLDPIATLETKFAKSSYFIADEIKVLSIPIQIFP